MKDNIIKVKVENENQLNVALNYNIIDEIILSRDCFNENKMNLYVKKIKSLNKKAIIMLERISRYEEIKDLRKYTDDILNIKNLDGIIVQNLDSYAYILRKINMVGNENLSVELNYTMNITNYETKKVYEELYIEKRKNYKNNMLKQMLSIELNLYEMIDILKLSNDKNTMLIYGYVDTMVSANCLKKNINLFDKKSHKCINRFNFNSESKNSYSIKDRKNKNLNYKTYCKFCYNKIFNVEPIYLIDKVSEIFDKNNMFDYRLDFTIEDDDKMNKILSHIEKVFSNKNNNFKPISFTRGHIKNGIK